MSVFLEQEIYSQPALLAHLLDNELEHIQQIVRSLPAFRYVVIAARGSSDHAATYAAYSWAALARYPVAPATPSLHSMYHLPPSFAEALVVGISQSGQSPDIVSIIEEGKKQGRPTLAITNDGQSPLAQAADHVVLLHVGEEKSVAATKTYTAQLTIMAAFAAAFSRDQNTIAQLRSLPEAAAAVLAGSQSIAERAERYRYMNQCTIIGRGYNYATAHELALKLKELTYVMAISYSSADFRHGPIAAIESGSPVILIMPEGSVLADMRRLAEDLLQSGAELLVISDTAAALDLAQTRLPLAATVPEWLSPITSIMPGQVFALHLAHVKGLNPDTPRSLRKVTKTV